MLAYCWRKKNITGGGVVPHSGSGVAPMSSLSGVELLGFWEFGVGGLMGEGRGK